MLDRRPYRLGLGTYSLTGDEGVEAMISAIEGGYRHLDTARLYGNEDEVGDAIAAADVDRDDLFVATKIAHFEEENTSREYIEQGVDESRDKLGVDTIDLLYHHWPCRPADIDDVLPVLADLYDEGIVNNIAVSNYRVEDIEHALDLIDVPIYANQVEMHPLLQQDDLWEVGREHDIHVVAYSPLAQGKVFDVPELEDIAEKHDTTPAVVSLAWLLSREGAAAIPRSSSPEHIQQNLAASDLELDDEDLARIASIEETHRCEDPDFMDW